MLEPKLIANRWIADDGTILQSKHRHDCVMHTCQRTGQLCMVDGGLDYVRVTGSMESMCVYSDDTHERKRNAFMWGSYGKSGKEPIRWIVLKDMEENHLWNILRVQGDSLPEHIREMFVEELRYRKEQEC